MEIKQLVYELLEEIIKEIQEPEHQEKIKHELLNPFINYIGKQMLPYIITMCIIIILILLCIIAILIIVIRKN
mgnify:CR=1 FL=1